MCPVTPEEAADFYEDDEDPAAVFAAFDAGTKALTARRNPETLASYTTLAPGGKPDGVVARTVEATESIWVDVDNDGTVLGVEVIGDGNWLDGLAALAMKGRLRVAPAT